MASLDELSDAVLRFIAEHGSGGAAEGAVPSFERLALDVFAMQYRENRPYRALCDRRGATPGRVDSWRDIPAVPTPAFETLDLACAAPEAIFLTSGTTRGSARRGRHLVPRLAVYREAALAHFRRMVLPDGVRPRVLGLLGGPDLLPGSSLTRMVEWLREAVADGDGDYLVDERGFDPDRAAERIDLAGRDGRPLCLVGLRVLFTALVDRCRETGRSFVLPPDSRIVDTGGPKGGRALSDAGFLAASWRIFGVPSYYCINEYGMTELCSQFYDDVLLERFSGSNARRRKLGPPWLRTRAVDPSDLSPVPDGTPGLLCHLDLANVGSVLAVQTEDLGIVEGDRFRLLGRLPGARARGCALALEDILGASR